VVGVVVGVLLLLLCLAVVVAIAKDRGPSPDDVAISYENAWDRFDFDVLWTLSAQELRDGLDRHAFVAAKKAAYADRQQLRGLAERVDVDDSATGHQVAIVETRVTLRDGATVRNHVELARRQARWQVVVYRLLPSDAGSHHGA
jgi:hypothetical protein